MSLRRIAAVALMHGLLACAAGPTPEAAVPRSRHTDPTLGGDPGAAMSAAMTARTAVTPYSGDLTLTGHAVGSVDFGGIGASCTGYGTTAANHVVWVDGSVPTLTLLGSSDIDTVMVVRLPSGEVLCNDDGGGYPNPLITTAATPGRYDVWVGTYSAGNSGDYTVTVSGSSGR